MAMGSFSLVRAEMARLIKLGWPIILTNLASMGMSVTDVLMLGWLGKDDLASGTLGVNLFNLPLLFGMGLVQAVSPIVAHALGERDFQVRDVRRTVRQGLWVGAFLCLPVWVFLWQAEDVFLLLGQKPTLAAEAAAYVRVLQWGLLPTLGFFVLRATLAAMGRPHPALAVTAIALGANALANYTLIFGHFGAPALGIVGAAVASLISSWLLFLGLAAFCYGDRRLRRCAMLGYWWRADWTRCREVLRVGVPIGFAWAFEGGIFNATVFLMGRLGEIALSAHAIAVSVVSLAFMIPAGLAQAATVRVAMAMGKGDPVAAGRSGWAAFAMGETIMVVVAFVFIVFPEVVTTPFLKEGAPASDEIAALAAQLLSVAGLFQVFDGAQVLAAGMLRGLKDTRMAMIFAGFGYWVIGLPAGALLAFKSGWGGIGLWSGLALGLAVVSALMLLRWICRERLKLIPSSLPA